MTAANVKGWTLCPECYGYGFIYTDAECEERIRCEVCDGIGVQPRATGAATKGDSHE